MNTREYPWYDAVSGEDIEQGDIFDDCPVFIPAEELATNLLEEAEFIWEERDVIVMSQTCDMVRGREKIAEVLLCPV